MSRIFAFASILLVSGCTTGRDDPSLPDASFRVDAARDASTATDGDLPPPTVDTCTDESRGSTVGNPCASAAECSDGCFCNGVEQCVEGTCVEGADPCVDDVECTEEVCLEETDMCFREPLHETCGDGDACNGYEVCDLTLGCRTASPLYCNDENSCTVDSCDTEEGCTYALRDLDGDGYVDGRCGGEDCDDDPRFGVAIFPGATEDCTNRRDDDCDGLRDYNDTSDCSPTNGTCETAILLPGPGTYSGSTAGLTANYTLGCGAGSGPDAVFRFSLSEMQDVRITVSGGGSGARVALRPWAQCATGPDEKCSSGSPPSILRRSLPTGEYAIVVKTSTGAPFDVNLMLEPPTPIPPVDVCDSSTLDVSAGGTFAGMFAEVEDDYTLSCHGGSTDWKDAAYKFTITEPKDVTIRGSTSGAAWTPTTYLTLTTDCSTTSAELLCRSSTTAEIRRRSLPAGTYYVLLESSATDATSWTLDVSITDPAPRAVGDACSTAVDITSGSGTAELSTAELDSGTSCGGTTTTSRDLFFYFDLTETRDVTLSTSGAGFHYVAVQETCGVPGSELRCRSGSGTVAHTFRSLPAGRYFVVVSTTLSSGTVMATITTGPPTPIPPNDRCSGAIDIGAGYSSRDTLVGFEDDVAACSGTGRPDAFYTFTLASSKRALISASRVSASTDQVYLTLRSSCTSTTNIACQNGAGSATINQTLSAGTYYLIVEMLAGAEEDYNLDAFFLDP